MVLRDPVRGRSPYQGADNARSVKHGHQHGGLRQIVWSWQWTGEHAVRRRAFNRGALTDLTADDLAHFLKGISFHSKRVGLIQDLFAQRRGPGWHHGRAALEESPDAARL